MDRREFVASFAALGATAALPAVATAQTNPPSKATGDPAAALPDALRMAALRKETTRQLTTFNLARKSKTIPIPRGKRVTIGEVKGQGYIAQFNTGPNPGPAPVQIAEAHGHGHYAGCLLYMQGQERNYLSFLEAPEYVWIDADWDTPRIVGTGLEDYFLGGWYFREGTFIGPYHGDSSAVQARP